MAYTQQFLAILGMKHLLCSQGIEHAYPHPQWLLMALVPSLDMGCVNSLI